MKLNADQVSLVAGSFRTVYSASSEPRSIEKPIMDFASHLKAEYYGILWKSYFTVPGLFQVSNNPENFLSAYQGGLYKRDSGS